MGGWAAFGCICLICPGQLALPLIQTFWIQCILNWSWCNNWVNRRSSQSNFWYFNALQGKNKFAKPFPSNLSELVLLCILRWLACLPKLSIWKPNTTPTFLKSNQRQQQQQQQMHHQTTDLQWQCNVDDCSIYIVFPDMCKSYPCWVYGVKVWNCIFYTGATVKVLLWFGSHLNIILVLVKSNQIPIPIAWNIYLLEV